jgi:DNA polymerase I-like protein with 3'-5' exonuclease and polymerase domains
LSAFASSSSRNQPSNKKFVFGPAVWIRNLIRPEPGRALAYIDFEQQEFGIAAALSGDDAMMRAYRSGDAYLAFAKQAGMVPPDATKQSHKAERELFKNCLGLGLQYGMGHVALGFKLGLSPAHGRELIQQHRSAYPQYWRWSEAAQDQAMYYGSLRTTFGWRVHVGSKPNVLSLRNFPLQANAAEMLRLAMILAQQRGAEICAPIHDALLIEAELGEIDDAVATCQKAMADASELVLPGFSLRTEARIFRAPEHYTDDRGTRFWADLWEIPLLKQAAVGID